MVKMISNKKLIANRLNFQKANSLGLNRHFGKDNFKWKCGISSTKNYPCPKCGKDRYCEEVNSNLVCRKCSDTSRTKHIENKISGVYTKNYKKKRHNFKQLAFEYKGSKCARCNVGDLPLCCYHFHHLRDKTIEIGHLIRKLDIDKLKKELDKCILLCANCHAIEHWSK